MKGLKILGTGRCLPDKVVTNDDMRAFVDPSDEWIRTRTGIQTRHFCAEGESTASLGVKAARLALERAGISPEDLGACVGCTVSADTAAPTVASTIQRDLGLPKHIPYFDLNAGCSGFLYGLHVTRGLLLQSDKPYALLVGAETLSRVMNFQDRGTCVIFGDGAGAVVVKLEEEAPYAYTLGAEGSDDVIYIGGYGSKEPYIHMEGQKTFRFAVEMVPWCIHELLGQSGLKLEDIDWFVLHQANKRIIDHVAKKLGMPGERFYQNIAHYGNTSAASIPIALDEMAEQGLLKRGQKLLCVGFGAGLTWGGALLEW